MYSTYVLYSSHFNKIYIGFSSNLENRLLIHNSRENKGWTAKYQPWEIFYTEEFEVKSEALKREKQLKTSRGRAFIWKMIEDKSS